MKRSVLPSLLFVAVATGVLSAVREKLGEVPLRTVSPSRASVNRSVAAIDESIQEHNKHPKRFVWTKDADMILAKIQRCKEALGTAH